MIFLRRYHQYFKEMQPLPLTVFFSLLQASSAFCFYSLLSGAPQFPPASAWYAAATAILFYVIFRLNDEIKDEDFDKIHHPNRPMVDGRVQYSDLKFLAIFSFALMVALNFDRGLSTSAAMVLVVFLAMSAHAFYFPDEVRRNFALTLATGGHPMLLIGNFYFYAVYRDATGLSPDAWLVAVSCVLFSLPAMAWEISRKIRAPSQETEFPSYSKWWGVRRATLIPITYLTIISTIYVAIGVGFHFSVFYVIGNLAISAVTLGIFARFAFAPEAKNNHLKLANELYDVAARLLILGEVAWRIYG